MAPLAAAIGVILLLAACQDTKVVEVERPFFPEAPQAAGGALGYDDADAKLTVCGNCHVGQQAEWEKTKHADAWATLQASGHARESCEDCHTVSANGNGTTEAVGWSTTQDPRYHDVQCESCHGPGATHVSNPDASQPLASIDVRRSGEGGEASLTPAVANSNACADCHQGTHHGFVDEWEQSPHAQVVEHTIGNASCAPCHSGQGTLLAWGENADYVEKNSSETLPVVCAVCHDPHSARYEHQTRFPVNTTSPEEHLCARCHNRRTVPDPASSHGLAPHAPETALLEGTAGWFPPGANIDPGQIIATHGSAANPELCATCHLPSFTVTDAETGAFTFSVKGHLFRPIPCLGPDGVPEPLGVQCGFTPQERYYGACTGGACHAGPDNAYSALTAATTRIQREADQLHALLVKVDPNLDAAGGEIDGTNPTFTVAEGAFFNYELSMHGNPEFGTNTVIGSTVHNPFLMEALLLGSIQAVEDKYGVTTDAAVDWGARLQEVLARAPRH